MYWFLVMETLPEKYAAKFFFFFYYINLHRISNFWLHGNNLVFRSTWLFIICRDDSRGCQKYFHNGRISWRSLRHVKLQRKLSFVERKWGFQCSLGNISYRLGWETVGLQFMSKWERWSSAKVSHFFRRIINWVNLSQTEFLCWAGVWLIIRDFSSQVLFGVCIKFSNVTLDIFIDTTIIQQILPNVQYPLTAVHKIP